MKLVKADAFSLIEIIFAVAIVSIIAIVAIPKLSTSLDKTNFIKIKSDILLIRDGLNRYKNKQILKGETSTLDSLDDNSNLLFNKILKYPIVSSSSKKISTWKKISDSSYTVWLDNETTLEFVYNKANYTFDCSKNDENCIEFSQ